MFVSYGVWIWYTGSEGTPGSYIRHIVTFSVNYNGSPLQTLRQEGLCQHLSEPQQHVSANTLAGGSSPTSLVNQQLSSANTLQEGLRQQSWGL